MSHSIGAFTEADVMLSITNIDNAPDELLNYIRSRPEPSTEDVADGVPDDLGVPFELGGVSKMLSSTGVDDGLLKTGLMTFLKTIRDNTCADYKAQTGKELEFASVNVVLKSSMIEGAMIFRVKEDQCS